MSSSVMKQSRGQQPPLVQRIYYYRARAMDLLMAACCSVYGEEDRQCLFLGAGLDHTLVQKFCCKNGVSTFCVDFEEVLAKRGEATPCHHVAADLRDVPKLEEKLASAGLSFDKPTVVILECVLAYLPREAVMKLLCFLADRFPRFLCITYDPLFGNGKAHSEAASGFAADLRHAFIKRGAAVHFSSEDADAHHACLRDASLQHVLVMSMLEMQHAFREDLSASVFHQPFDEFNSLVNLHKRYGVSLSAGDVDDFEAVVNALFRQGAPNDDDPATREPRMALLRRCVVREDQYRLASSNLATSSRAAGDDSASDVTVVCAERRHLHFLHTLLERAFHSIAIKYKTVRRFIKTAKADMARDCDAMPAGEEGEHEAGAGAGVRGRGLIPSDERGRLFVALEKGSGRVLGCVGISQRVSPNNTNPSPQPEAKDGAPSTPTYELKHMCVCETARRRGVGYRLLLHALRLIRRQTPGAEVHLSVVADLLEARRLYTRAGFREVGSSGLGGGCMLSHMVLAEDAAVWLTLSD